MNKVGLPNLQTRRDHQLATSMFKVKHKMPEVKLFAEIAKNIANAEINHYDTRQTEFNFELPKLKLNRIHYHTIICINMFKITTIIIQIIIKTGN